MNSLTKDVLIYLTRQEILYMKLCNGNTWTNTSNSLFNKECLKTSFIYYFLATVQNLFWQVIFLFFCSWWLAEEYLFAVLWYMWYVCIVHKNCIILHFYTSCHIKEYCAWFLFFENFVPKLKMKKQKDLVSIHN